MSNSGAAVTLEQLLTVCGGVLIGDGQHLVCGVAPLAAAGSDEVAALTAYRYRRQIETSNAGCIILAQQHANEVGRNYIIHPDPALAFAQVNRFFNPPQRVAPRVAASAVIDSSATVSPRAEIAANVIIGAGVVIADDVFIGPGSIILDQVEVGAQTRLIANVTLCDGVVIGARCLLHPGAVIGSDGFGFASDAGQWLKVPQIGRVLIGDDVEIGANTTIDRGSLRDTVIGNGVKLDNQIQIAHNVIIGDHTAIAGLVGIAGSTTIGRHCTIAGEAGVIGHLSIGDHCHIGAQALVTRSLQDGSDVRGGVPAVETGLWRRMIARLRRIDSLVERVTALEKLR